MSGSIYGNLFSVVLSLISVLTWRKTRSNCLCIALTKKTVACGRLQKADLLLTGVVFYGKQPLSRNSKVEGRYVFRQRKSRHRNIVTAGKLKWMYICKHIPHNIWVFRYQFNVSKQYIYRQAYIFTEDKFSNWRQTIFYLALLKPLRKK